MTSVFDPSYKKRAGPDDSQGPQADQTGVSAPPNAKLSRQASASPDAMSLLGAETADPTQLQLEAATVGGGAPAPDRSSTPQVRDFTPAPRAQRRKLPTEVISPSKGCSSEELRVFSVNHVTNLEDEVKKLRAEHMTINEKVDKIWPFLPQFQELLHRFESLGNVVFPKSDAKASFEAVSTELGIIKAEGNSEVLKLRGELSEFAEKIQASTAHIQQLENQFKNHVEQNFSIVEKECLTLRAGITQAITAQATGAAPSAASLHATLEVNELRQRIDTMETNLDLAQGALEEIQVASAMNSMAGNSEPCHCEHCTEAFKELNLLKETVNKIIQGGSGRGGSAPHPMTPMKAAFCKCPHCVHVDELGHRMINVEGKLGAIESKLKGDQPAADGFLRGGVFNPMPQNDGGGPGQWPSGTMGGVWCRDPGRMFDDKVALSDRYSFSGGEGATAEKWAKTVKGHWISKCTILDPILKWIEEKDDKEITLQMITMAASSGEWMVDLTGIDLTAISHAIWGFLNNCVKGEARETFDAAATLDGFNAWRLIMYDVRKSRWVRLQQLRKLVRNVPPITKIEDVVSGIAAFDATIKDYKAAGGIEPDDIEKKADLLESLPQEIRENLHWRSSDPNESYTDFRNHIKSSANTILYHRGKFKAPLHMVEGQAEGHLAIAKADNRIDEIMAILNKMGFRPRGGQQSDRGRLQLRGAGAPGPNDRPMKCINCGSTDHLTRACTKAEVPKDKRPCWKCGKPGHLGRDCRSGGATKLVDEPANGERECFGLFDHEGFAVVKKKSRPMPKGATLGSFIDKNAFEIFMGKDEVANDFEAAKCEGSFAATNAAPQPCIFPNSFLSADLEDEFPRLTTPRTDSTTVAAIMGSTRKSSSTSSTRATFPEISSSTSSARATFPEISASTSSEDFDKVLEEFADLPPVPQAPAEQRAPRARRARDLILDNGGAHFRDLKCAAGCRCGFELVEGSPGLANHNEVMPLEYEEIQEEEVLATGDEVEIEVVADSGAVGHVTNPDSLPGTMEVRRSSRTRNFVAANNNPIKNHGEANTVLELESGAEVESLFQVADVSRPLHSVSTICDNKKEMLFTAGCATVVPAGALSRFLTSVKNIAQYPRKGGLYVAKMKAKDPKAAKTSGFGRPGNRR